MTILVVLAALAFLMSVAYRGFSVILFAPVAAMLAVLVTDPAAVAPMFVGVFKERFSEGSKSAVAGSLLASVNTASEYGFGAVITLLAVTGLTHKTSYRDIFVLTCMKTVAVFFVIAVHYATGLV